MNQEKLLRKTSKKKQEKEKKTFIDAWRRSDVSTCFYLAHARSTLVRVERASQLSWQRCMSPLSSANREKGLACVVSVACRLAKSREDRSTKTRKICRDSFSRINLFSFVFSPYPFIRVCIENFPFPLRSSSTKNSNSRFDIRLLVFLWKRWVGRFVIGNDAAATGHQCIKMHV